MIVVETDGACEPINPGGIAAYGYVVYSGEGVNIQEDSGIFSFDGTNNEAEYAAVLEGLKYLVDHGLIHEPVLVKSDSNLIVCQLSEQWRLKAPNLIPLFWDIKALERQFPKVIYRWVPRLENVYADLLSRAAYDYDSGA